METYLDELLETFTVVVNLIDLLLSIILNDVDQTTSWFAEQKGLEHHPVEDEDDFQLIAAGALIHLLLLVKSTALFCIQASLQKYYLQGFD